MAGHGVIASPTIEDTGTIEAKEGTLTLQGNVTGGGGAQIDTNSTLDLAGSVCPQSNSGPIFFNESGTGTLCLNKTETLFGTLEGMSDDQATGVGTGNRASTMALAQIGPIQSSGDKIILGNTSPNTQDGVVAATIGIKSGNLELQIVTGTDWSHRKE